MATWVSVRAGMSPSGGEQSYPSVPAMGLLPPPAEPVVVLVPVVVPSVVAAPPLLDAVPSLVVVAPVVVPAVVLPPPVPVVVVLVSLPEVVLLVAPLVLVTTLLVLEVSLVEGPAASDVTVPVSPLEPVPCSLSLLQAAAAESARAMEEKARDWEIRRAMG